MGYGIVQEPSLSGRHVIESDDAVAGGEKAVHHMTADKSSRARN
jgi:hypothetical protein